MVGAGCRVYTEVFEVKEAAVAIGGHPIVRTVCSFDGAGAGECLEIEVVPLRVVECNFGDESQ